MPLRELGYGARSNLPLAYHGLRVTPTEDGATVEIYLGDAQIGEQSIGMPAPQKNLRGIGVFSHENGINRYQVGVFIEEESEVARIRIIGDTSSVDKKVLDYMQEVVRAAITKEKGNIAKTLTSPAQ